MDEEKTKNDGDDEINAEDIKAFLGATTPDREKPERDKVKLPAEPAFSQEAPTIEEMLQRMGDVKRFVEVTEHEKEIFLKSVMHDSPFELEIKLPVGSFTFRSRNANDHIRIYKAYEAWAAKQEHQENTRTVFSTLQRYLMAVMLVRENDNQITPVVLPENLAPEELKPYLDEASENAFPWSDVKWNVAMKALSVFESKKNLLLEKIFNENFWSPGD
jgi:hypothetical protein